VKRYLQIGPRVSTWTSVRSTRESGAGDGGALVLRELNNNLILRSRVVGFIDDDRSKHHTKINGVPVVGGREDLPRAISELEISQVIVSSPKVPAEVVAEVRSICDAAEVPLVRASLRLD